MTEPTDAETLTDEQIRTVMPGATTPARSLAQDTDGTDADGTDGDAKDGTDGDSSER